MPLRLTRGSLLILIGGVAAPIAAAGAQRGEIAPLVGLFAAPTDIAARGALTMHQKPGIAVGARGTWWRTERYGVEGTLTFVKSNAEESGMYGRTQSASLGLASVRLAWRADSTTSRLRLSGGLASIGHGGEAYGDAGGRTDFGVAIGAGWRVPMSESRAWRVDIDDYLYSAKFDRGGTSTSGRLQSDLVLSVGLSFALGH